MLIRATAKSYNKIMAEVVSVIRNAPAGQVGQALKEYFASQRSEVAYWPDDDEVRRELEAMPVYRKLSRARVRMVLESDRRPLARMDSGADLRRGHANPARELRDRTRHASIVAQALASAPWRSEPERDARIHRLGNLTLLTKKLNSTVSNGPWLGEGGKAAHLQEKDVVLLNSKLLKDYSPGNGMRPASI